MKKWKRKVAKLKSKTASYKNNSGALNCDYAVTNSKGNKYHVYKVCSFKVDFDEFASGINEIMQRNIRAMSDEELDEVLNEIVKELDYDVDFDALMSDMEEILQRKGLSSDDIDAMSGEEFKKVLKEIAKELDYEIDIDALISAMEKNMPRKGLQRRLSSDDTCAMSDEELDVKDA